jgi:uncharacterized protein YneF (UPF0154 family)
MGVFLLIIASILLVVILGYAVYMEDQLMNPPSIPETESERSVRSLKMRIADAEWKFKREIGEQ